MVNINNTKKKNITKKIKNKALEIGFDLVGITGADPFKKTYQRLKKRKLSPFIKKDLQQLTTPKLHLPQARSIIALGLSYASLDIYDNDQNYISLYARGRDYHHVMNNYMNKFKKYLINNFNNVILKTFCDTGTLLDKEIAARAGLGWIGKNNNLINPEYGSFLFLGEIITNLDLKYDRYLKQRCRENCRICLENCPTGALNAPYDFNYKSCISYLTQKRGILSEKERFMIGDHLWGCDYCQLYCPYNKNTPVNLHSEFKAILKGEPVKIINFTKKNIPDKWKNSALYWRGLRILKRNTIINLGNKKNKNLFNKLLKILYNEKSPILRAYAAWAIAQIDIKKAQTILKKHISNEKNNIVIKEINNIIN